MTQPSLRIRINKVLLEETSTYDVAAVRIEAIDQNGNVLPFANEPLKLSVEGPIALIGPELISLQGGMTGTYVKTTGEKGSAYLIIESGFERPIRILFDVR